MGRPQQSGKSCKRWRRGISRGTPESAHKKNHPRECGSVQADIALRISQAGVCQHSTVTSEPRSFLGGPAELPFSELEVGGRPLTPTTFGWRIGRARQEILHPPPSQLYSCPFIFSLWAGWWIQEDFSLSHFQTQE